MMRMAGSAAAAAAGVVQTRMSSLQYSPSSTDVAESDLLCIASLDQAPTCVELDAHNLPVTHGDFYRNRHCIPTPFCGYRKHCHFVRFYVHNYT